MTRIINIFLMLLTSISIFGQNNSYDLSLVPTPQEYNKGAIWFAFFFTIILLGPVICGGIVILIQYIHKRHINKKLLWSYCGLTVFGIIGFIISNNFNNSTPITYYIPYIQDKADELKSQLPIEMGNGLTYVNVEYKDSAFINYFETDDNENNFNNFVQYKEEKKQCCKAFISDGKNPQEYEIMAENGISLKYVIKSKQTQKSITITFSPKEIKEILEHPLTTQERLIKYVEHAQKQLPLEIDKGLVQTNMKLEKNTMLFIINVDEDLYNMKEFKSIISKIRNEELQSFKNNLYMINLSLMMSELGIGLTERYVGSHNKESIELNFTSEEIEEVANSYAEYKQKHKK